MTSTSPSAAGGEPIHNRDLAARSDAQSPGIGALLDNAPVRAAFATYEDAANRLKRRYERLGLVSVVSIGLSASYGAYRLVWPGIAWLLPADLAAAALGALGIVLDLYIRWSNLKLRWLVNRFGAERIRSIKFQLYVLAAYADDPAELAQAAGEKTDAMIAEVAQALCLPVGALNTFHARGALDLSAPASLAARSEHWAAGASTLLPAAIRDYREWRVKYQHVFAEQMSADVANRQRGYNSLSDALFVMGAAVLIAGIAVRFLPYNLTQLSNLLEASGLAMFIWSAVGNVLSSGASHLANGSRYQQYARGVSCLLHVQPRTPGEFVQLVEEMELLALRELDDFWRDVWISSYRS